MGRLAFGQTATTLTPYAALGGAPAVTFAIALVGSLLAWVALSVRTARPRLIAATLVGVAVIGTAGGLVRLPTEGEADGDRRTSPPP